MGDGEIGGEWVSWGGRGGGLRGETWAMEEGDSSREGVWGIGGKWGSWGEWWWGGCGGDR